MRFNITKNVNELFNALIMRNASKKTVKNGFMRKLKADFTNLQHLLKQTVIIAGYYRTGSTPEEIIKTMFPDNLKPEEQGYKSLIEEIIQEIETESEAIRNYKEEEAKKASIQMPGKSQISDMPGTTTEVKSPGKESRPRKNRIEPEKKLRKPRAKAQPKKNNKLKSGDREPIAAPTV